jgi:hypothetical protein
MLVARGRRWVVLTVLIVVAGCLGAGLASAKLPHPKRTAIVPGTSIGGVKLGMTQAQVFHVWGSAPCGAGVCTWWGSGNRSHAERATVTFYAAHAIQIDINAGTTGTNEKFRAGQLSKWKTSKHIGLGSTKQAVKRAYPAARANNSTGVAGYDLFFGGGIGLHYTRFSTFGVGASANRVRYIELACYLGRC